MKPNRLYFILFLALSLVALIIAAIQGGSRSAAVEAILIAIVMALVLASLLAAVNWLFRKQVRKFSAFAEKEQAARGGWLAAIGTVFVAFAISNWASYLLEYLVICHVYGHTAWAQGLRVIGKGGELSNGDALVGWQSIVVYGGTAAAMMVGGFCSFMVFRYVGYRLRGRRFDNTNRNI